METTFWPNMTWVISSVLAKNRVWNFNVWTRSPNQYCWQSNWSCPRDIHTLYRRNHDEWRAMHVNSLWIDAWLVASTKIQWFLVAIQALRVLSQTFENFLWEDCASVSERYAGLNRWLGVRMIWFQKCSAKIDQEQSPEKPVRPLFWAPMPYRS